MESNEEMRKRYLQIWEQRRRPPSIIANWVDNEWAKGRTRYLVFLVRVQHRQVVREVIKLQEKLACFPCIDTFPPEYLHLTVKETGRFLVEERVYEDDLIEEDLKNLVSEAEDILSHYAPFRASLQCINNFIETLCIEVYDNGLIREINGDLLKARGIRKLKHDYPLFLPHLSIAQFKNQQNYSELIEYLEANRDMKIADIRIDTVELVKVILPKEDGLPKPITMHTFRL
jgi:2'-5' RNA ligase